MNMEDKLAGKACMLAVAMAGLISGVSACSGQASSAGLPPGAPATSRLSSPAAAWSPSGADKLWPCSLIPATVSRQLDVNASDGLLPGQPFAAGAVYSCSEASKAGMASVTVNVGSGDPSGSTAGYTHITLAGNIPAWQEAKSASSMGASGGGWDVFIQVLSGGNSNADTDFYGGIGCTDCTKAKAIALAQQVAAAAVPAETQLGGAPPSGVNVAQST